MVKVVCCQQMINYNYENDTVHDNIHVIKISYQLIVEMFSDGSFANVLPMFCQCFANVFPMFCFQCFVSNVLFPMFCFQCFVSNVLFPMFCQCFSVMGVLPMLLLAVLNFLLYRAVTRARCCHVTCNLFNSPLCFEMGQLLSGKA